MSANRVGDSVGKCAVALTRGECACRCGNVLAVQCLSNIVKERAQLPEALPAGSVCVWSTDSMCQLHMVSDSPVSLLTTKRINSRASWKTQPPPCDLMIVPALEGLVRTKGSLWKELVKSLVFTELLVNAFPEALDRPE